MNIGIPRRRGRLLAIALVAGLALAGCSSKAGDQGDAAAGGVRTGAGISGDTIGLGIVTDLTGPFSLLANSHTIGIRQYWDEKNAAGGVCGTYDVELVIRDHAFSVPQAVSVYQELTPDVLAYQDFSGDAHVTAILPDLEADSRLLLANAATQQLADSPLVLIPAALIATDMQVIVSWLVQNGIVAPGATVASIYQESGFGEQANEGAAEAAAEHGLTVLPYQVKPTDADLTSVVTDALRRGAMAVLAATSPPQTASVATVLQSAGVEIPIGGIYSTFAPALLDTPAADYLSRHYHLTSYVTTYETDAGSALHERLSAADRGSPITSQTTMGYTAAKLLDQVLESACAAGDLTPEGVAAQRLPLGTVTFDGLKTDMNYSTVGASPATAAFIVQPDSSVPGRLRTVSDGTYDLGD